MFLTKRLHISFKLVVFVVKKIFVYLLKYQSAVVYIQIVHARKLIVFSFCLEF